jgi:hypothetical protein
MALDEEFLRDLLADFLFLQVRSPIYFNNCCLYFLIYISAQRLVRYAFQYRRARRGGISV